MTSISDFSYYFFHQKSYSFTYAVVTPIFPRWLGLLHMRDREKERQTDRQMQLLKKQTPTYTLQGKPTG